MVIITALKILSHARANVHFSLIDTRFNATLKNELAPRETESQARSSFAIAKILCPEETKFN